MIPKKDPKLPATTQNYPTLLFVGTIFHLQIAPKRDTPRVSLLDKAVEDAINWIVPARVHVQVRAQNFAGRHSNGV